MNATPLIESSSFTLSENARDFDTVGAVAASDPDPGQTLRYSLVDPNLSPFFINRDSGVVRVKQGETFDFESVSQFQVEVTVTDNGSPTKSATAVQTINILDENEQPSIDPGPLSVAENSAVGTVVGTVAATDPDTQANQSLTFNIVGGTGASLFEIDAQ